MSDTPFIPEILTPGEFLEKFAQSEVQEMLGKSIDYMINHLIKLTSTMQRCNSLQHMNKFDKLRLENTLKILVDKVQNDSRYATLEKPMKLSNIFSVCEDFNDPFAILNYGSSGLLLLRILSLIDKEGFAKEADYVDENRDRFNEIREAFRDSIN